MFDKVCKFIKKEAVLTISFVLALVSSFFVHPDAEYIGYIDFRTLSILLMLMLTMAGLQMLGVFKQAGEYLVCKAKDTREMIAILVALSFFSAMVITNDVALITFVPFTIISLEIAGRTDMLIITVVLETIAANLGSMLLPIGNPQNLYLYSKAGMSFNEFLGCMLPYSIFAFVLLAAVIYFRADRSGIEKSGKNVYQRTAREKRLIGLYALTFVFAILVVVRVVPYEVSLIAVLALVLIFDIKTLRKPDYSLLFTFVFLFVFIGNMKRIPAFSNALLSAVNGNEVMLSVALSQVISNVPAAILLSGFTGSYDKLIVGTNLGGLGTLIASMASLISFKLYCNSKGANKNKYILVFTGYNLLFLAALSFARMGLGNVDSGSILNNLSSVLK